MEKLFMSAGVVTAIVLFILTIFLPENVMGAVEIVKSLF